MAHPPSLEVHQVGLPGESWQASWHFVLCSQGTCPWRAKVAPTSGLELPSWDLVQKAIQCRRSIHEARNLNHAHPRLWRGDVTYLTRRDGKRGIFTFSQGGHAMAGRPRTMLKRVARILEWHEKLAEELRDLMPKQYLPGPGEGWNIPVTWKGGATI